MLEQGPRGQREKLFVKFTIKEKGQTRGEIHRFKPFSYKKYIPQNTAAVIDKVNFPLRKVYINSVHPVPKKPKNIVIDKSFQNMFFLNISNF